MDSVVEGAATGRVLQARQAGMCVVDIYGPKKRKRKVAYAIMVRAPTMRLSRVGGTENSPDG